MKTLAIILLGWVACGVLSFYLNRLFWAFECWREGWHIDWSYDDIPMRQHVALGPIALASTIMTAIG